MGECEVCQNQDRIDRLESDVRELRTGTSTTDKKLIETSIKLDILIETVKENNEDAKKALKDLQIAVNALAEKPGKRWDLIVNTIITGIVSALVGAGMVLILIQ